jgi:phage recombination protein Bet
VTRKNTADSYCPPAKPRLFNKDTMSNTAVVKKEERQVEYVPFGSEDKIKLSATIIQRMVCVPTKSGKVCSEIDAIKFIMLCQAQRLNPFAGDCWMIGYDGKDGGATFSMITAHQAFLKRAETHKEFDGIESGVIIQRGDAILESEGDFMMEGDALLGGWAKVHFKSRSHPMYKRLSLKQRKPSYYSDFWAPNKQAEQIVKCSEADALRASFPTLMGGLYSQSEVEPKPIEMAKPIFNSTTPEPAPVEKPIDVFIKRCGEAGVSPNAMVEHIVELGMATDCKTLEDVDNQNPEVIPMLLTQFDDFIARIKA